MVPTKSKLDQCMFWPLDVSKKDACSVVLDMVWLLQGTPQVPSFINEENNMYCQRLLHEVSMKTKPTPENKWNLLHSFFVPALLINSTELNTTLISWFKINTDQIALASMYSTTKAQSSLSIQSSKDSLYFHFPSLYLSQPRQLVCTV